MSFRFICEGIGLQELAMLAPDKHGKQIVLRKMQSKQICTNISCRWGASEGEFFRESILGN